MAEGFDEATAPDEIHVRLLRAAEVDGAGDLLMESHFEYPSFRHLFPVPIQRRRVLQPFMRATVKDALVFARCYAAWDEQGLLGVAVWMPPGTFPLSPRRKARMTPGLLRAARAAPRAFPAFARMGARLEKTHPAEPVWYLEALGVHPRAQRRGVGTRLMAPALSQADRDRTACFLLTSDPANVDYYERFDFTVTQPAIRVLGEGPHYIGMSREPRA